MLFLPDTNAFSYYLRGEPEPLMERMRGSLAELRLSSIVLAELEFGAAKVGRVRQRERVDRLMQSMPVEPFRETDAAIYGRLRAGLQRRGELIGPYDLLIAAQALRLGATLVTHNVGEFRRVPGLIIEDWQAG